MLIQVCQRETTDDRLRRSRNSKLQPELEMDVTPARANRCCVAFEYRAFLLNSRFAKKLNLRVLATFIYANNSIDRPLKCCIPQIRAHHISCMKSIRVGSYLTLTAMVAPLRERSL